MGNSDQGCFSSGVVSQLQVLADEVSSLAHNSESNREIFAEFVLLLDRFKPILIHLKDSDNEVIDRPTVRKAMETLARELSHVKELVSSSVSRLPVKQVEDLTQDLGRSLGLVLYTIHEVSTDETKDKVACLHEELMNVRFVTGVSPNPSPSFSPSPQAGLNQESEFDSELESEKEIEEEGTRLSSDDVVLQLKYGDDHEFRRALIGLSGLMKDQVVDKVWIDDQGIVQILLNRLSLCKPNIRPTIIRALKALAVDNKENKEKMADAGPLSLLVKSLTRDADERREAVALLLELSDISSVKRRIGRIQGCIVLLVTIINGDDPTASRDAGSLLTSLSTNTQNALYMAEAGYFRPLVHHLKQGSDMSKILMASALSRIELTDQRKACLGEDGAVEPLVDMFRTGKLESKLSALNALQSLSSLTENVKRLISSGILVPLLQLLFSVTSVLMVLREPASAILARISQSETILVNQDVALQMLSLLTLSSPVIQYHLLQALNGIASQPSASKVRRKMQENGAVHLLFRFITENNIKIRTAALDFLYTLSKDSTSEFAAEQTHLNDIVNIFSSSTSESEKAVAIGIISNLTITNKETKDILKKSNLLPAMISTLSSSTLLSAPVMSWLAESISSIFVRLTIPSDKKLQLVSAEHGVIPLLVKLLSSGSVVAKGRAAISLAQLSQNSIALNKSRKPRWPCMPRSTDLLCEVHEAYCTVKSTFCLVKANAVPPLIQILEGNERDADESALNALATFLQDDIWENGCNYIAKMPGGVKAVIRALEIGNVRAQEKAIWMLERIFRIEEHKVRYGPSAQVLLIDLAQIGDPVLKPTIAKLLAQLELLQLQSSYF